MEARTEVFSLFDQIAYTPALRILHDDENLVVKRVRGFEANDVRRVYLTEELDLFQHRIPLSSPHVCRPFRAGHSSFAEDPRVKFDLLRHPHSIVCHPPHQVDDAAAATA
jgi:hypothetical protein